MPPPPPRTLLPLGLPIPTRPFHGRGESGVSAPWGICLPRTIPPRGVPIPKRPLHGQGDMGVSHTYYTPMGHRYTYAALSWPGALGCIRCLGAMYHAYHTAMQRNSALSAAKGLWLALPLPRKAYLFPHNLSMAWGTRVHLLLGAYVSPLPYRHGPFLAPLDPVGTRMRVWCVYVIEDMHPIGTSTPFMIQWVFMCPEISRFWNCDSFDRCCVMWGVVPWDRRDHHYAGVWRSPEHFAFTFTHRTL